ncbi:MAG: TonB-dependent receptor [Lentisphaerae bacterium]|nr:TonB-dependent receptor [Lentisphaerota bacterium]
MDLSLLSIEELLNVKVTTASKRLESLPDAPGVISVITRDELKRFGGTTLKDILERIPSLVGSGGAFTDRSMVASRGDQIKSTGGHNLILINGRPTREILEGGISSDIIEAFPIGIIERIEVIRGPGSVLYGSDAFSTVINIVTQSTDEDGLTVRGQQGEFGAYGTSGEMTFHIGDVSIIVAGRHMTKADWNTPYQYFARDTGNAASYDTTRSPNEGYGAYLEARWDNLRLMGALTQWETGYFLGEPVGRNRWRRSFADLGYAFEMSEIWLTDLHLTYTRADLDATVPLNIARESNEFVSEWTHDIELTDKVHLLCGVLYSHIDGHELDRNVTRIISEQNRDSFGGYAQADYWCLNNLKLIAGFQANKVENIDLDVVPRAGAIWHPVPRINVKALYSEAFRAPSINETSLQHPNLKGNPDVNPERVDAIDLGVTYLGDHLQAGVNLFQAKQTDIIAFGASASVVGPPEFIYDNVGEVTIRGVELSGKCYLNKQWFLTGSLLYQEGEDNEGNQHPTPIPALSAKAGISYMSHAGTIVSLFDTWQDEPDKSYDALLNKGGDAFHMLSLHCKADLRTLFGLDASPGISVFLQVDNLLDEEVWLPDWLSFGRTAPANQGRAAYIGIEMSI